jgi:hypothetical protein
MLYRPCGKLLSNGIRPLTALLARKKPELTIG